MLAFIPAEIIKKKRNGFSLSEEEIQFFIQTYTRGDIPDYQMSALTMAIYFRGMSREETLFLTKAMLFSGDVVDFSSIPLAKVDKHSTGGVGDKTSLILAPIVAAGGVAVPMISGRGLGHTGGTLDKLESIPGFNTQLDITQFKKMIAQNHLSFIGQTKEICPADKKIYALRDVTATVESLPLICASIMSKKLAEGIDGLVLDVKYGNGAFMKELDKAEELALNLMNIAKGYGKKVATVLSDMNQPLGRFAGNSLEVRECIEIMENKTFIENGRDFYQDTRELSVLLAGIMFLLGGRVKTQQEGVELAQQILSSGKALEKFREVCAIHGGRLSELPASKHQVSVKATTEGYVSEFNTEAIGVACIHLQAGRQKASDVIEPTSGIEFHKKIGDAVKKDEIIFTIHGSNLSLFKKAEQTLQSALRISLQKPTTPTLVNKVLY